MTSAAAPDPHHRQRAPVARSPDPVSTRQAPPRAWQYASPPAPSFPTAWVCPRLVLRWGCSKIAAAAAVRSVSASSTWPPRKPPYGIARLTPMASPASRSSASFAPGQGLCRPLCPAAALLVLRRRRPPVVVGPSSSCTVAILSHLGQNRDRQVPRRQVYHYRRSETSKSDNRKYHDDAYCSSTVVLGTAKNGKYLGKYLDARCIEQLPSPTTRVQLPSTLEDSMDVKILAVTSNIYGMCTTTKWVPLPLPKTRVTEPSSSYHHVNNYFHYRRRVRLLPTTIVNDYTA